MFDFTDGSSWFYAGLTVTVLVTMLVGLFVLFAKWTER